MMKQILILVLLLSLCFPFINTDAAPLHVSAIHAQEKPQTVQLDFLLSSKPQYRILHLKHPQRLVLDITDAKLKTRIPKITKSNPLIKKIRTGYYKKKYLRFVFDLNKPVQYREAFLRKEKKLQLTLYTTAKPRRAIVVIDAGHGGKDPGATGPRGIHEKKVVLSIARQLRDLINKEPDIHAILTRYQDHYVGLRRRLRVARRYKADIFVSIHADAYKNRHSRGVSVFALSPRGASSEAARWLAEKENQSELFGNIELQGKSHLLQSVLLDLSQTATIRASLELGNHILSALQGLTRLHYKRVEQAGFVVLKSPDIPSVLIETGFLSNPSEEQLLRQTHYQKKIAYSLMKGIRNYFSHKPPRGTLLAYREKPTKYIINKGDTLARIAHRFDVTTKRLRFFNHLSSNILKIGQVLHIPPSNESIDQNNLS